MKEYNPETHFVMSRKASNTFKWFKFIVVDLLGLLALMLLIVFVFLWATLQVLSLIVALI